MGTVTTFAAEWLEPLRAYPRWLVLLGAAVATASVLILLAKALKWGLYLGLAGLGALVVFGFAVWLGS